jgi:hypothetical protein
MMKKANFCLMNQPNVPHIAAYQEFLVLFVKNISLKQGREPKIEQQLIESNVAQYI